MKYLLYFGAFLLPAMAQVDEFEALGTGQCTGSSGVSFVGIRTPGNPTGGWEFVESVEQCAQACLDSYQVCVGFEFMADSLGCRALSGSERAVSVGSSSFNSGVPPCPPSLPPSGAGGIGGLALKLRVLWASDSMRNCGGCCCECKHACVVADECRRVYIRVLGWCVDAFVCFAHLLAARVIVHPVGCTDAIRVYEGMASAMGVFSERHVEEKAQ